MGDAEIRLECLKLADWGASAPDTHADVQTLIEAAKKLEAYVRGEQSRLVEQQSGLHEGPTAEQGHIALSSPSARQEARKEGLI